MEQRFLKNKNYYYALFSEDVPNFGGNLFTVTYKEGSVIYIVNTYNPEIKLKCKLEESPNMDIITLPNGYHIWRDMCQQKFEDGSFERLELSEQEEFEF